ncbi:protein adenylyltransferase SelO family protein [Brachybacterium sp. J144]|uniref:protein adenylyltransferase SelO n=1 Tax=Brachybacterium sp. J144 TaxID=3116487 RepID=UPI002E799F12|nr:protein adenylyltransferase SelO family protein [Brachybacterium sp. J144]MEE1650404.1 protein adenylyltransferase SelO family protein [Brachybacterium sp. J144]
MLPLQQTYAEALPELSVPWRADLPPDPAILWLNESLAVELGLDPDWLRGPEGMALLTGQIDGTVAQAYAGHQFGSANPQLGDGRAVLLGELIDTTGRRVDLHLKGSGRTPFARGGDGKAPLGPMLREAVIGEFLHAAGVPTTRALAVLTTGERIAPRQGVTPEPGALLVRVAASHLRVGTVQAAAWHHGPEVTGRLVDHVITRHHPSADGPLGLLAAVTGAQAELVAQWMLLGFVHGVMNTDNMALSGEGIDYGPCAFLDVHRNQAVFSSIDRGGRYAYGNQPGIALWNLSRFAEVLLPVIDAEDPQRAVDAATAVLEGFEPAYRAAHARGLAAKLGIPVGAASATGPAGDAIPTAGHAAAPAAGGDDVTALGADLFSLLEAQAIDHTGFFHALTDGDPEPLFTDPDPYREWAVRRETLRGTGPDRASAADAMAAANPVVIPRNLALDSALRAAHLGDPGPVLDLLEAVAEPFAPVPGREHLEGAGEGGDDFLTYCGT